MARKQSAAGMVTTVICLWCASAADAPAQEVKQALEQTKVDMAAAVEAALQVVPGATLIEVDLEKAGQTLVWELDLLVADALQKAQVDVDTGKVIRVWDATAEEPGEAAGGKKAVAAAKVTWQRALEAARQAVPDGRPLHIELDMERGAPLYTVELLAGDKRVEVRIDAVSGKPLKKEGGGQESGEDDEPGENDEKGDEDESREAEARAGGRPFTDAFQLEQREFASTGHNPYFILEPGYQLVFEGQEGKHSVRLTITVLHETRQVGTVETRVVEERETKNGELIEVSRNYFAICKRTNDVFYFGETTDEYEAGQVVGHEGAWEAGVHGARPGLMMPGTPLLGARFYQEVAPKVAMDRAEIVSVTETLKTPAGEYKGCLKVEETTPLEPGTREYKLYAPGIGLIKDGGLVLVEIKKP